MLVYEDFVEEVKECVSDKLGDNADVMLTNSLKNNGIMLTGIIIRKNGERMAPIVYLGNFYNHYRNGGSIDEISEDVISEAAKYAIKEEFDISFYEDFGKAGKHIVFRLISKSENEEKLKGIPHREYLGMAIVYCCLLDKVGPFEGCTITVTNEHMAAWKITEEELYNAACKNTPKLLKVYIEDVVDFLCDKADIEDSDIMSIKGTMYVISNKERLHGAAAILYPGVLKKLADKVKSSLYLIPSSVHEFIAVPDTKEYKAEIINEMINDVNRVELSPDEVLGYQAYYYDRNKENLAVA